MAQAAHGSAPDIAGENIANPIGIILSTAMLFEWLSTQYRDKKLKEAAELIENSLRETVKAGIKMGDTGSQSSTSDFAEAIAERIGR